MSFYMMDVAWAQGAQASQPNLFEILLMPAAFLIIIYFMIIRPQQKRHKEQQALINNLKVGDEIVTSAGIIGRVRSIADTFVTIEAGPNTTLKIEKNHINSAPKAKFEK